MDVWARKFVARRFGWLLIRREWWWLQGLYWRWQCPGGAKSVRQCIADGECGCDNLEKNRQRAKVESGI